MTSPDYLAPYAVRVRVDSAGSALDNPRELVGNLLEDIARWCVAAGATLLGHLKCHARTDAGTQFRANLTNLRSGARTVGDHVDRAHTLDIDLVVLIYGLEHLMVHHAVDAALTAIAGRSGATWAIEDQPARPPHKHPRHPPDHHHHGGDPH